MNYIGSDHAGYALKQKILSKYHKYNLVDLGADSEESTDYPIIAQKMGSLIEEGDMGILICGSGIGMSIAANRFKNIRAALCVNQEMAELARKHNNANVLVLGSRVTETEVVFQIIDKFFNTAFEAGRHQRRIDLINGGNNANT